MSNNTPASEYKRNIILAACRDGDVHMSAKTRRWMDENGIRTSGVLNALAEHIEGGFAIFVKVLHQTTSCHGSLLLNPEDDESLYFEVKIHDNRVNVQLSRLWLQVHPHDPGFPQLPR